MDSMLFLIESEESKTILHSYKGMFLVVAPPLIKPAIERLEETLISQTFAA